MRITEAGTAPPEPPAMPPARFWGVPGQVVGPLPSKKGWGGCQVLPAPQGGGGFGVPHFGPVSDEERPVDLEDALDVEALGPPTLRAGRAARPVAHEDGVVLHI